MSRVDVPEDMIIEIGRIIETEGALGFEDVGEFVRYAIRHQFIDIMELKKRKK